MQLGPIHYMGALHVIPTPGSQQCSQWEVLPWLTVIGELNRCVWADMALRCLQAGSAAMQSKQPWELTSS